jgi:hypothetical protein
METVLSGREVPESHKLFGSSNYALWSFKVHTVLQGERLWKYVDPDLMSGSSVSNSGASSSTPGALSFNSGASSAEQTSAIDSAQLGLS